jgi:hypothetical protein
MYTDNLELTTSGPVGELSWEFEPHVALSHSTVQLSYDAAVAAGFVVHRTLSDQNQATQDAAFDLSYHLSQFWVLRASDSFRNTLGLWSGVDTTGISSVSPGVGTVQQPNPSLLTFGPFRENIALAELSAQLSATSYGGVRGEQTHLWFPSSASVPALRELVGGDTYSAEVFYNHHFSQRNWGSITARVQRFDLAQALSRTDTGSVFFMYAINIRPTMTLSFFGGPQLAVTSASATITPANGFQRRMLSPNAGAVFTSENRTTSASLSFIHGVSDGAGLSSAVTLNSADAHIFRRFARRFEVGPGFLYSESTPIVSGGLVRTYSARLQSTVRFSNCSLRATYSRDDRNLVGSNTAAAANSIWIAFSYDLIRPIGQ